MNRIITRAEWSAEYGQGYQTDGAKTLMIVHHDGHTRSRPDMTTEQEQALMRFYEDYHVNGESAVRKNGRVIRAAVPGLTRTNPRIAYSFVVMQSGRLYEGCGWGRVGAHTMNMNSSAYAAFFPLNGARTAPTAAAIASFAWLQAEGVRLGHLTLTHGVKGHQDFNKPTCPGQLVYAAAVLGTYPTRSLPTIPDAIAAHPTLRRGKGGIQATGDERAVVAYLQQRLIALGAMAPTLASGSSAASGYFGPATDAAVRKYQTSKGLLVDGIVGAKSWALLTERI